MKVPKMRLYLHIPFCESKCFYCSFTSRTDKSAVSAYFDALLRDVKCHFAALNLAKKSVKSLFIGGGTPSIVDIRHFEPLFEYLEPFLADNAEQSIEANPNSATFAWLKKMREFGINRVSFGAQSFSEKKLKFLGRIHSPNEIYKSLENAVNSGFENINLDMIYDSKLDDKKMLKFELENLANAAKMGLTHISAYHLMIEENSAFRAKFSLKKNAPNLMKFFMREIENLGFPQYEVSNFGQICEHNLAYWKGEEYLGCGLSAVSFVSKDGLWSADCRNLGENSAKFNANLSENSTLNLSENSSENSMKFNANLSKNSALNLRENSTKFNTNLSKNSTKFSANLSTNSSENSALNSSEFPAKISSQKARFYTHKSLAKYLKEPTFRTCEALSERDLLLEHLFLGLRSCVGISPKRLNQTQLEKAKILLKHKKLIAKDEFSDFSDKFTSKKGKTTNKFINNLAKNKFINDFTKNNFTKLKNDSEFKNKRFFNPNFALADEIALFLSKN